MSAAISNPGPSGVLVIDKPLRLSSMDAVAIVRTKIGRGKKYKVGHAGTLDPLATGVLVMAIGPATKSIDRLMSLTKRYETSIDLSAFTRTDDLEGERTEVQVHEPPSETAIRDVLKRFEGEIQQRPPAFSAIKIGGTRSYKMARRGELPSLQARDVIVHQLEMIQYRWPRVDLRLHCDKGFYVRSLARDLGIALSTGGHCHSIRRTAVGPFTLDMARHIDELPQPLTQEELVPLDVALARAEASAAAACRRLSTLLM
jgi:tRNA pseudouridine55 synthase